jgi:hypothetical protein
MKMNKILMIMCMATQLDNRKMPLAVVRGTHT